MADLASQMICKTFQAEFKDGAEMGNRRGMLVEFYMTPTHEEDWHEDYYPKVQLLVWSPTNYTKVFVRERDLHHKGEGPWRKIHDHDSCWREGVEKALRFYESVIGGIEGFDHWFKEVEVDPEEMPTEWSKVEDARFLPDVRGLADPVVV